MDEVRTDITHMGQRQCTHANPYLESGKGENTTPLNRLTVSLTVCDGREKREREREKQEMATPSQQHQQPE